MAKVIIKDMEFLDKERNYVQNNVSAGYTYFDKDGKRYFQIDTYGTSDRQYVGKCSQTFQIDEQNAKDLISLLNKVFNF